MPSLLNRPISAMSQQSRLYVGQIPVTLPSRSIMFLFQKYGELDDFDFRDRGKKTNFCFVEYTSAKDAERAMYELNGHRLLGVPIIVSPARERRRGSGGYRKCGGGGKGGRSGKRIKNYTKSSEPLDFYQGYYEEPELSDPSPTDKYYSRIDEYEEYCRQADEKKDREQEEAEWEEREARRRSQQKKEEPTGHSAGYGYGGYDKL